MKAAIAPFDHGSGRFFVQSQYSSQPSAVLPLAMVLNELCTNAVKYGALSSPTGRVEITATVDDAQKQFRLKWTPSSPYADSGRSNRGKRLRSCSRCSSVRARAAHRRQSRAYV